MACAAEAVVIPMKNTRLSVTNDVFSAEILMFTEPPLPIDPLRSRPSRDCWPSGSDHRINQGSTAILTWLKTHTWPDGENRRTHVACRVLRLTSALQSRNREDALSPSF